MSFELSFERFCELMSVDPVSVKIEHIRHKVPKTKVDAGVKMVKDNFQRLFGFDYTEVKENIDTNHFKVKIEKLWRGKASVCFGKIEPSGNKRKRKSLNESLSESFLGNFENTTVSENDSESELAQLRKLVKRQAAIIEMQDRKIKSLQGVFTKSRVPTPKSRNSGGSVLEFSEKAKSFALGCLSMGIASSSIRDMMQQMAMVSPECLELDDGVGAIPSRQTLDTWRNMIPGLNRLQCQSFIDSATKIAICTDTTEVSGTSILNIGAFNQNMDYVCLISDEVRGRKTADVLAEAMKNMVEGFEGLSEKVIGVVSDSDATQLLANRLLGQRLGKNFDQFLCSMHTCKNLEEYWNKFFPKAKQAVDLAARIFGTRQNAGNQRHTLRPELEIALNLEKNIRFSPFRTSQGSRFAIDFNNARELICHREIVIQVCNVQKAQQNPYACQLKQLMTTEWDSCLLELGAVICHWKNIITPFYSTLGKIVTLGTAKASARELIDRYNEMKTSNSPYDVLLRGFEANHSCYGVLNQRWGVATQSERSEFNSLLVAAAKGVEKKVTKDTNVIFKLNGDHMQLVPMTNKRCESTFSLLKVNLKHCFTILNIV